ncbi:carbohydrate kinase family protein [Pinirhizobacter sp.]|jgi:sugar/nucleoside kinase (ribokinase family)|uniref:carbohydrate kinase family protein n=1 Tax=Pinirhizobacter sp. TaxID=2950432 RepID=UPI002F3F6089
MKPTLVAGELNLDYILSGVNELPVHGGEILANGFRQTPGSSSMICAMGLARLGNPVRFAGRTGRDERGDACVAALAEAGIDTRGVARDSALATGATVVLSGAHDRALVTFPGAIGALKADDIDDDVLAGAGHLHVSSYFLQTGMQSGLATLFERARMAGVTTSLDPGFDPAQAWAGDWQALLSHLDVFLPNEIEACAIAGHRDASEALHVLSKHGARVVIKRGAGGCIALDDDRQVQVPAFLSTVVDTTGAGDSFDAGFLHAWLRGMGLVPALRWASACGSLSTRGVGGTTAQATQGEVRVLLEATP